MQVRRGDIWRTRLPGGGGHAQAGERPAVIIQADSFNNTLPTTLVIPFTSNLRTARFPGTFTVQPDGQNGLSLPSVAMVFQTRVVDQRDCLDKLGELDS